LTVSVTKPPAHLAPIAARQWFGPLVYIPAAWLVVAIAATVFAGLLPLPDPFKQALLRTLQPPSAAHWLGTDSLGRDVFSRSIVGLRVSLIVGIGSVAFGLALGGALGLVSGYFRGLIDLWISAVMTVVLSFPPLVLAIAIMSYAQPSLVLVIVVLGILFVPAFARIARANTLSLVEREFVLAARAIGMRDGFILLREILPNLVAPLAAYSMLMVAVAIIGEAALSFLGLSVPPPQPTLGGMIAAERANLLEAPWSVFGPAGFLFLTILSLNIVGDQVQRRLDGREAAI
jgi:peptide/nickel transport system permease protein